MPFDDAHLWAGDALPEPELPEFQQGKYNALLKLLPYAREGSREAASVVLKLDGSEFDFEEGEIDSVYSLIPRFDAVAHLHSHPENWAHSEEDWNLILSYASVEQTHVIAPDFTYSLHKPSDWNPLDYDLEEVRPSDIEGEEETARQRNENKLLALYSQLTMSGYAREGGWSRVAEIRVRESANQVLATHFGMKRRIGHRKLTL